MKIKQFIGLLKRLYIVNKLLNAYYTDYLYKI